MKIEKFFNKKEKKEQWRARFQFKSKRYKLVADTRSELVELIDEVRVLSRRVKHNLPVAESPGPKLADLFARVLKTVKSRHRQVFCERVFNNFLDLLPAGVRVKELKKSHYQTYIDWRRPQLGRQSRKPIKLDTVYKELWAISGALGKGELYWDELENWKKPVLPKHPEQKKSKQEKRRKKIVSPGDELYVLLDELRKPRSGRQTEYTEQHRRRLADELEFRYETGLRRKEVARLEPKQYFADEEALRNVRRWKTGTTTKYFPLSRRAVEIIENRIAQMNGSSFIFTKDGKPVDSDYRTLKIVCRRLEIPYGIYTDDGFIPHDLRHNFASEVIKHADIETVRELLGHSNIGQTGDYLHTDERRMREAIRKREGIDIKKALVVIYKDVRRKKMDVKKFIEAVKKLTLI